MLVQRLGIVFAIFFAFALSFGTFVHHAKSGRADYQGRIIQIKN
ncbi:hypothetical protein [Phyllobacterium sp. SB3]